MFAGEETAWVVVRVPAKETTALKVIAPVGQVEEVQTREQVVAPGADRVQEAGMWVPAEFIHSPARVGVKIALCG